VQKRIRLSSLALIAANLAPLAGVLFLGWSVSSVIVLYWFENVVLGVLNVARMALSSTAGNEPGTRGAGLDQNSKSFLIPFFILHYFFFCAGHGVFVFALFPDEQGFFPAQQGFAMLGTLWRAVEIFATPLAFAAFALAASHVVSFFVNYLGGREYESFDVKQLMRMPYGRIVVLHLTILFGAMAITALNEPIWSIVILVAVKSLVDLGMHLREHRQAPGTAAEAYR